MTSIEFIRTSRKGNPCFEAKRQNVTVSFTVTYLEDGIATLVFETCLKQDNLRTILAGCFESSSNFRDKVSEAFNGAPVTGIKLAYKGEILTITAEEADDYPIHRKLSKALKSAQIARLLRDEYRSERVLQNIATNDKKLNFKNDQVAKLWKMVNENSSDEIYSKRVFNGARCFAVLLQDLMEGNDRKNILHHIVDNAIDLILSGRNRYPHIDWAVILLAVCYDWGEEFLRWFFVMDKTIEEANVINFKNDAVAKVWSRIAGWCSVYDDDYDGEGLSCYNGEVLNCARRLAGLLQDLMQKHNKSINEMNYLTSEAFKSIFTEGFTMCQVSLAVIILAVCCDWGEELLNSYITTKKIIFYTKGRLYSNELCDLLL